MEPLTIGMLGGGVVGTGVARLLRADGERLAARAGRPLELVRVAVRDRHKPRDAALPADRLTTDSLAVARDQAVQVVVEVIGGIEPARTLILAALAAGKDVVTANKAVLAEHGDELFAAAHAAGRCLAFEASVGGGVPIIQALAQGLAANRVDSIQAILNGTSNFILTQMAEDGLDYPTALALAQRHGYAEADPTLDVDGSDAAHKLAVLARLAFGLSVPGNSIERRGITELDGLDFRFVRELGYVIKLLAEAWLLDDRLALHVEPTLVRRYAPLAEVRGPNNAIQVTGHAVGQTLFYGPGAGSMPTASAVVADLVAIASGSYPRMFHAGRLGLAAPRVRLRSAAEITSRFYLRCQVQERVGVLAEIDGTLAQHKISIASVVQHEEHSDASVPVVLLTHGANLGAMRQAVAQLDQRPILVRPCVFFPIAE
ncbi:MAG TPA: homoserine dehydrogenase [Gemmatales bacterium]|nr:homoserine dehydrogenase [Gemmatales bacterium]